MEKRGYLKPAQKVQKLVTKENTDPELSQEEGISGKVVDIQPKKAKSAYTFFLIEKKPEVSRKLAGKKVMKKIGSMWKKCSDAEKMPYIALAEKDKKRYESEVAEFKKSGKFYKEVVKGDKPMKRRSASPKESAGAKRRAGDNKKRRCFNQSCENDAHYVCLCLCNETYSCEFHFEEHLKLSYRNHSFDSISEECCESTKVEIFNFLEKEYSKKEKLQKIVFDFYKKWQKINSIEESLREINFDLKEIRSLIEQFSPVLEQEKDAFLYQLMVQPITDNERTLLNDSNQYNNFKLFCRLCELRKKRYEILNRVNSNPEIEQNFRQMCSLYKNSDSVLLYSQAYEKYIKAYQKATSLYVVGELHDQTCLFVYDTESENEAFKVLNIEKDSEGWNDNLIFQLPNGELFFVALKEASSIAMIMNRNYELRKLPVELPKKISTAIYYNKIVYCFGKNSSYPSIRFDLDRNSWSRLSSTKLLNDEWCSSVVFKGNILISDLKSNNLLRYSIDLDSFSKIPYKFRHNKILIPAEERLYLIELGGWIYESEIGNEYAWKQIRDLHDPSVMFYEPIKVNWSYNKGGIYIAINNEDFRQYFKFDLSKKELIELAFYTENLGIKKSYNKLEAINWCPCNHQTFQIMPDHAAIYTSQRFTLYHIGRELNVIERYKNLESSEAFYKRGSALSNLERKLEAKECIEKALKLIGFNGYF